MSVYRTKNGWNFPKVDLSFHRPWRRLIPHFGVWLRSNPWLYFDWLGLELTVFTCRRRPGLEPPGLVIPIIMPPVEERPFTLTED